MWDKGTIAVVLHLPIQDLLEPQRGEKRMGEEWKGRREGSGEEERQLSRPR